MTTPVTINELSAAAAVAPSDLLALWRITGGTTVKATVFQCQQPGSPSTFADGDTTPSVLNIGIGVCSNSTICSIVSLDDMADGQIIRIKMDANTFIVPNTSLKTEGGDVVQGSSNDIVTFVKIGSVIYMTGRSVNGV